MQDVGAHTLRWVRRAAAAAGLAALLGATAPPTCALYALGEGSQVQEGCFAPCLCVMATTDDLHGFLVLRPLERNPADFMRHFQVLWVRWTYDLATHEPRLVTGSGTYDVGGEILIGQHLALDLAVGDEPLTHYDSGVVAGGSDAALFPPIDIAISRNDRFCYDRVFTLHAKPVL
jgi:hypothetical protein